MFTTSSSFTSLRRDIAELPIIDCHEHVSSRDKLDDVIQLLLGQYLEHDAISAVGDSAAAALLDASRSVEERWPDLEPVWRAIRHTGYGIGARRAIEALFGTDEVSLSNLTEWQARLPDFSQPEQFDAMITGSKIEASVSDNWPPLEQIVNGSYRPLPWQRLAVSLPSLHRITRRADFEPLERAFGTTVTSLDEYVGLCRELAVRWRSCGAVCMKDQSAYTRSIAYRMPAKSDAECEFNAMLENPRSAVAYDATGGVLSDYLMHAFMRIARDLDLPVQLHTGHMAGTRNDVAKANAAGLRSLLEVHRDVRFDLFHANWPYMGDLLFLAKNYPNVSIDMCWAYAIDPLYAKETLKHALLTVPATKIHGFGSDVGGDVPHLIRGYSEVARDVIAAALAELVDERVIAASEALDIASMWLYENPRGFFGLG